MMPETVFLTTKSWSDIALLVLLYRTGAQAGNDETASWISTYPPDLHD